MPSEVVAPARRQGGPRSRPPGRRRRRADRRSRARRTASAGRFFPRVGRARSVRPPAGRPRWGRAPAHGSAAGWGREVSGWSTGGSTVPSMSRPRAVGTPGRAPKAASSARRADGIPVTRPGASTSGPGPSGAVTEAMKETATRSALVVDSYEGHDAGAPPYPGAERREHGRRALRRPLRLGRGSGGGVAQSSFTAAHAVHEHRGPPAELPPTARDATSEASVPRTRAVPTHRSVGALRAARCGAGQAPGRPRGAVRPVFPTSPPSPRCTPYGSRRWWRWRPASPWRSSRSASPASPAPASQPVRSARTS